MLSKKRIIIFLLTIIVTIFFTTPCFARTPEVLRLAGTDRYSTAAAIAKQGWAQSNYVVLAYGENFPDALSSGVLANKYNAPILLTKSTNLPNITRQTLIDLQL